MQIIQHSLFDGKVCDTCGKWVSWAEYRTAFFRQCKTCERQDRINAKKNDHLLRVLTLNKQGQKQAAKRARESKQVSCYASVDQRRIEQIYRQSRRADKCGVVNTLTLKEWIEICERHDNQCARCGQQGNLHIDHIIPIVKGGANTCENVQPLCRRCNGLKNTQAIDFRLS